MIDCLDSKFQKKSSNFQMDDFVKFLSIKSVNYLEFCVVDADFVGKEGFKRVNLLIIR